MSFIRDYKTGLNGEKEIINIINNYFNRIINKTTEKYCRYDFYDNKYKYELKTRNNTYNTYPTTIIAVDKVVDNKLIFLFNFTDSIYYIKYNKELFDTFEKKMFVRQRADFNDIEKEYFFIPIEKLTLISQK